MKGSRTAVARWVLAVGLITANVAVGSVLFASRAEADDVNHYCVNVGGHTCECQVNDGTANNCTKDSDCSDNSPSVCGGIT
jgi:hypothetical protein